LYCTLRVDSDPTSWELTDGVEEVPTSSDPVVLPVYHPLLGDLVLSSQSMGSAVFLEYRLPPDRYGTRPNGMPMSNGALYLPSPTGPDRQMIPPNIYALDSSVDLGDLKDKIIAAMTDGTFLTVKVARGEVVINGARLPFAVLCEPNR
jgi:hypothetical protein